MSDFFDEISRKAEARRNTSWDRQQQLINSGIMTPSLANGSMDDSLTGEQAQAKVELMEQKERQTYSDLMAAPVGAVEGMIGFGGDIERLGRGAYGAATADSGNRWDSFLNELGNSDTTLWNTENVQGWTNRQLEGTDFGNRLLEGKGGRLLGEVLAPLPPVVGAMKYGGKGLDFLDEGVTAANKVLNRFDIQPGLSIKSVGEVPVGAVDDVTMAKSLGDRVVRTAENSEHIRPPRFGIDGKPLVQEVQPVMPRNTPITKGELGYSARYGEDGIHANLSNAEDFNGGASKGLMDNGTVNTDVVSPNGQSQVLTDPMPMQTIETGAQTSGPQGTKFFDELQQPTQNTPLVRNADGSITNTGELTNDIMRNTDGFAAKQLDNIEEGPMSNWYDNNSGGSMKKNIAKINEVADKADTNFTGDMAYKLKAKSPEAHSKVIESIALNRQELPDVLADNLLRKASDITADTAIDATTKEKLLARLYEVYDDVTGVNINDGVATNKRYGTNIMERPRNQMDGVRVQEVGGLTDEQMATKLDSSNTFKQVDDLDDIEYNQGLQDNGVTDKLDEFDNPVFDSDGVQVKVDADGNDIINQTRLAEEAKASARERAYRGMDADQIDTADGFKQRVHNSQRTSNITDVRNVADNPQVLPTDGAARNIGNKPAPSLYDELGGVEVRGNTVGNSPIDAGFEKTTNARTMKRNSLIEKLKEVQPGSPEYEQIITMLQTL